MSSQNTKEKTDTIQVIEVVDLKIYDILQGNNVKTEFVYTFKER